MRRSVRSGALLLLLGWLLAGETPSGQLQVVIPVNVASLENLTTGAPHFPNGPHEISAQIFSPRREPIGTGTFAELTGVPGAPFDFFTGIVNLDSGGQINFAQVTPRDGGSLAAGVFRNNLALIPLHAGKIDNAIITTQPAIQPTAPIVYVNAFRETSNRVREASADGLTSLTYWPTAFTWELASGQGATSRVGVDLGVAYSTPSLIGSLDLMQLGSDPNARVLVHCIGPRGTSPTCAFSGLGTFRNYFGTAAVHSLVSLGLTSPPFVGASDLIVSSVPAGCIAGQPPPTVQEALFTYRPPGPNNREAVIGAWTETPCTTGYEVRIDNRLPDPAGASLFQQNIPATAFGLFVSPPRGDLFLQVTPVNQQGPGASRITALVGR